MQRCGRGRALVVPAKVRTLHGGGEAVQFE